ncbi:MAG: hypothetical protein PUB57_10835 [Selenomonadaceae bacterium]|nr:hypothetical protein [Selenomonadaceae bacterium]
MAKEKTGYTKASVLAQSTQAMLAQVNQNADNVLLCSDLCQVLIFASLKGILKGPQKA